MTAYAFMHPGSNRVIAVVGGAGIGLAFGLGLMLFAERDKS